MTSSGSTLRLSFLPPLQYLHSSICAQSSPWAASIAEKGWKMTSRVLSLFFHLPRTKTINWFLRFLFIIHGTPLQYSCLENPMDGGAWQIAVHGVEKSRTRLSDFTFTFHFHALEKKMATHSSILAWRILGTGETGGLPSMGSHGVGHDWSDLEAAA